VGQTTFGQAKDEECTETVDEEEALSHSAVSKSDEKKTNTKKQRPFHRKGRRDAKRIRSFRMDAMRRIRETQETQLNGRHGGYVQEGHAGG